MSLLAPPTPKAAPRDLRRIAVLNRGEPAVRFLRALRDYNHERGTAIAALAFVTTPDRDAPFVRLADDVVDLGPARIQHNGAWLSAYTDHDRVLDALERARCDAVWPGWGFVAEDATFVAALEARGICFIGPSAAAMRRLGDKIAAKEVAAAARVPMAPWHAVTQSESYADTEQAAITLGFPLIVKSSSGGGGRGIRRVTERAALAPALAAVREEAQRSFGEGGLFLETCVTAAHHIEVQLVVGADGRGAAVGLRDCTVQRRHQKVLEEAPPPTLPQAIGEELLAAAVRLGETVEYRGVGTVEFLVDPTRDLIHFLEVNTRLQVEHTVTEAVTGLDLVHVQLDIARGLPWDHDAAAGRAPPFTTPATTYARTRGHAIEVRLNAEDPDRGFAPSPGRVQIFRPPLGPGLRVDSGVVEGIAIAPEFDSMIAKIIATGRDRAQALARLERALAELEVGIEDGQTNKSFLVTLLQTPEVRAASADTGWLDRAQPAAGSATASPAASPSPSPSFQPRTLEAICAAAILVRQRTLTDATDAFFSEVQSGIPYQFHSIDNSVHLALREQVIALDVVALGGHRWLIGPKPSADAPATQFFNASLSPLPGTFGRFTFTLEQNFPEDQQQHIEIFAVFGQHSLNIELGAQAFPFTLRSGGEIRASAPALVVAIHVAEGQAVQAGERLCTLEAMKMEVPVIAAESGTIRRVLCRINEQVQAGQVLLELGTPATAAPSPATTASRTRPHPLLPLPPPRGLDLLFAGRDPNPAALARLAPPAAAHALADLTRLLAAALSGWDLPPALAQRLQTFLTDEDAFRVLADPTPFKPLVSLIGRFVDLEHTFARDLDTDTGRPLPARLAFFEACRRLTPGLAAPAADTLLHPELRRRLLRALAPLGVTTLSPSPELAQGLWRLAASQAHGEPRQHLANALLRVALALHAAGLEFHDAPQLELWLARAAELARPDWPALRDNARQARYILFRRQRMPGQSDRSLAACLSALGPSQNLNEHQRISVIQTIWQRVYGREGDITPIAAGLGLECREIMGFGGVRSLAVLVNGTLAARALATLNTLPATFSAQTASTPFELHLFLSDANPQYSAPDALAPLLNALHSVLMQGAARRPTRIAISWTPDGQSEHHRSWRVHDELRPEPELNDVHPEQARRLELWRLSEFEQERLVTAPPLLAIRGRARDNPRDERIFVFAELTDIPTFERPDEPAQRELEWILAECLRVLREAQATREPSRRSFLNRIILHANGVLRASHATLRHVARRLEGATRGHGLQKVVVQARVERDGAIVHRILSFAMRGRSRLEISEQIPSAAPIHAASDYYVRVERARRLGTIYPYEIIRTFQGTAGADLVSTPHPDMARGHFTELDLDPSGLRLVPVTRPPGENQAALVVGLATHHTRKFPEGMSRVFLASDPTRAMGALSEPECRRILAAIDLAQRMRLPIEWIAVSAGAKIAMDSGTENLDWSARVLAGIVAFTEAGGEMNIIVAGVNVGAQSYWNAEATMLMHTRGVLIQTGDGSLVLTGKKALEVSGSVAAADERGIGGYDPIMGPNGQAQFRAQHLGDALRILFEHYVFTYVSPGERTPRRWETSDPDARAILDEPCADLGEGLETLGDLFSEAKNPGRKRPFAIRAVMGVVIDQDGGHLERFADMEGAETAVVWDAHLGGMPVCVVGIESRQLERKDRAPLDGPERWSGGTLYPQSSKKVARALNQASGNRPTVVLANLSGFDGSPESMRKLQLEYGAEIGRAVVNFRGPIVFVVIGRYHGGAYVVFSKALNPNLTALAVAGSYASVIGGAPAAAVVFPREVRARALKDPRVVELRQAIDAIDQTTPEHDGMEGEADLAQWRALMQAELDRTLEDAILEYQGKLANEFDAIHTVDRAVAVGSLDAVIAPEALRSAVIEALRRAQTWPMAWHATT